MARALALIGWALIGLALLCWAAVFAVPFLPMLEGRRWISFMGLWLGGEILFTIGALMAAPLLLKGRGAALRKWFGKKEK
jgi:hypothetical protein